MKKTLTALALASAFMVSAQAQNVAVVNGKPIPSSRLEAAIDATLERNAPGAEVSAEHRDAMREQISEHLIMQEILVQEAQRRGLENTAEYKRHIEAMRYQVLMQMLQKDFIEKNKPSDADIQAEYDRAVAEAKGLEAAGGGNKEYKSRHILVPDEKQAQDLIAQLNKGANFAELAKKHSQDPGSGANGGDLGWANPGTYVPEFGQALGELKKGQYSKKPVQTTFGYHILLLEDERENAGPDIPPLEEVKDQVAQSLMEGKMQAFFEDLRSKAKIK